MNLMAQLLSKWNMWSTIKYKLKNLYEKHIKLTLHITEFLVVILIEKLKISKYTTHIIMLLLLIINLVIL